MRKLIGIGCGAIGVAVAVALLIPTPACTNHQCDPADIFGEDAGPDGGPAVPTIGGQVDGDPNAWESNPLFSPWLHFPGQTTYAFYLPPQFSNRAIVTYNAYLAVTADPFDAGSVSVVGAGNSVEFTFPAQADGGLYEPPIFYALNDTCAEYWTRVVVTFAPANPADVIPDTGADVAPATDAEPDAEPDDASDGGLE